MRTLQQKLVSCANYSKERAQVAEANLIRIREGLAPVNPLREEVLGAEANWLKKPEAVKRSFPPYRMRTLPVTQRCKPLIPTPEAFDAIKSESLAMMQARFGINPPRDLSWRKAV